MRVLLLLRGAPGVGKTTWIKQNGLYPYTLSSDDIRLQCTAPKLDVNGWLSIDQTADKDVWATLFKMLELRMRSGAFTVIDATNSKTSELNRYKDLCDSYRYRIFCVDFTDVPIETVKQRNAGREPIKRVPEEVIDKCYSRFATQKIPSGIKVIKPDELDSIWLKKFDLNDWKKIHVIGDIHGCKTVLRQYFENDGGFHDDEFYIFLGDYIDRGIENAEMIKTLFYLSEKKNVLLLEGNHERWLWSWANDCPAKSREFEFVTKTELDNAEIDKKAVRKLYRRFGQCAYFDYAGSTYLVTHGGLSTLPQNLTLVSTEQMIRGVGNYSESEDVDNAFCDTMNPEVFQKPAVFQIHGHRNVKCSTVQVNAACFNLEGRVEFGGNLRCVQLLSDGSFKTIETQNTVFKLPEEPKDEDTERAAASVGDAIIAMRSNKFIQEKSFGDISSFNFTKQAFYDKVWDAQTTKARGLYIDVPHQKVVARAYDKFFNINERPETKFDMLSEKLVFPVTAYVKENGFLGIVSYNEPDDSLFITTKSCPDGDFAGWLKDMLYKTTTEETREQLKLYAKENNVSFVFECVDIKNDPHIISYPFGGLYLLDIVYNDLKYHKLPFDELCAVADRIGLVHKERAYTLESWQDFFDWYYEVTDEDYLYKNRHIEGFVIEDAGGYMLKLKLAYYNFWKFMRSVAHETIKKGYIDPRRTSSLVTPLANAFYGWIKECRAVVFEGGQGDLDIIPKDIVTLRAMFYLETNFSQ